MSDVNAIAGNLVSYRTLADGALRITVDLPETETQHFHALFPAVHREVAITPLRPVQAAASRTSDDYGAQAQELKLSAFTRTLAVWRASGADSAFLEWVRTQKCVARSGLPCDGPIQAAHVWRLKDDFGKGVKGDYAAVPLCAFHHRLHHQETEDAIGGREYMEAQRVKTVSGWVWAVIKDDIGVASMRDADPAKVLAWCQKRGIDQYLPQVYREAA
jgi:hypothetical protein